jgi:eukaryotic-like serine/threonine-protein kinase
MSDFPRKFGKYHLLAPLAQGGMGALYLATAGDSFLEKLCVIKTVLPHLADAEYVARFRDEAKVVVKLSHGNLVPVFDAGQVGGEMFVAMDFIEGKDLRAVWNRCARKGVAFPVDIAVQIVKELCRGLAYAHGFGDLKLVHRDVSPPNVLISFAGEVKLTDFGLASSTLKIEKTAPGVIYGKVSYMAPEQARGEALDGRTDLYAAGIILWELLTGRQLFPQIDGQPTDLATRAKDPHPDPPSRRAPRVPPLLDEIVVRALASDRDLRYQSGEEMRAALAGWLAREAPATDAARMEKFVTGLFAEDMARERADREAMVIKARERLRTKPPLSSVTGGAPKQEIRAQTERGLGVAVNVPPPRADGQTVVTSPVSGDSSAAALAQALEPSDRVETDFIGQVVDGRYVVRALIGEGGMGKVYEAEHVDIGKRVALKILHPVYTRLPEVVARFRREARAASKIGHPNIVDVTDSGTTVDGSVYFVMEYLEGVELAQIIDREGAMDVARALNIGTQMCRALAAAHSAGIIHRDLKPENVFLIVREGTTDFVKILDFGIAKSAEFEEQRKDRLTHPGMAMGTPEYMAPEQAAGRPADARSDVYAVGAILYEMMTGEAPYQGENFMEILTKKATVEPTPPRQLRPDLGDGVERAVLKALARDPAARPPSMEAFEYELTKCLAGRGVAVAKVLGMPVDPSAMSPYVRGENTPSPEPAYISSPPTDPPRGELVQNHSGRVAELGLAALGSPRASSEADLAESTAVVTVPKAPYKWMAFYFAALIVGGVGIAWYAIQRQDGELLHRPAEIMVVAEETSHAAQVPAAVAAPGIAAPAPTAAASADGPSDTLPGHVVVAETPIPTGQRSEQSDLFAHTVEHERHPPSDRLMPLKEEQHEGPPHDKREAEQLLDEAKVQTTQMDWQRARGLYERVSKGRFRRAEGLLGLANVAWQTNDVDAAIGYAQKALEAGGGDAARMMLGHAYLKNGAYDQAIAQYHAVLKNNPGSKEAHKSLREAQRQQARAAARP